MPDAAETLARDLAAFADDVAAALGPRLVCCAVHGSAARGDHVAGRSDVNTVVVVAPLDADALVALRPAVRRAAAHGFALPLVIGPEFLEQARDVFPIELDDLARHHRVLAGRDVLAAVAVDRAALRRQCEHEARALVLRLRALLVAADMPEDALVDALAGGTRRALVLLRHLVRLRGGDPGTRHAAHVDAAEAALGPLPALRALLAHREGRAPLARAGAAALVPGFLGEAERLVAALDALGA